MVAFQESHNNSEFLATYFNDIPPDPTNKVSDEIENDDSKAVIIPLKEVRLKSFLSADSACPLIALSISAVTTVSDIRSSR